jgi:hypothetical protein
MSARIKAFIKLLSHKIFVFGQRFGLDVLPRHFYSEIPDIRKLHRSTRWRKRYSMQSVAGADCKEQLDFLRKLTATPIAERATVYESACRDNGVAGYGPIEAELLLHYVVACRPRSIVQIGAGVSTAVILRAAKICGYKPDLTCIDPFPTQLLHRLDAEGSIRLIKQPVEDVHADLAGQLRSGDLLFTDSTHTLGPAGEVSRLILEWLPCLNPGVRLHFHDIIFPYDYQPDTLTAALFFPHESALLHAFLCMNPSFRILCSLSMLHHDRRAELATIFPNYRPCKTEDGIALDAGHFPSSIFLERTS